MDILRKLESVGRLNAAFGLFEFAKEHLTVNLRARHPSWTKEQIHTAVRQHLMATR